MKLSVRYSLLAIILFNLFTLSVLNAQENPSTLYNQGKYSESLEQPHKTGLKTAADYYNAANCLFKLGKLGTAYGYFLKSSSLSPSNDDIRFNLALTKKLLSQSSSAPQMHSFWVNIFIPFSRQYGALPECFFILTCLGFLFCTRKAQKGMVKYSEVLKRPVFILGCSLLILGLSTLITFAVAQRTNLGVVVSDIVVVRSGPGDKFTELTKLVAGANFKLNDEKNSTWRQIEFTSGNIGWIEEKDIIEL